ncbi:A disintegrin and metalloproteinase with thrombospondin motifs 16 [Myotis davidii]|uniref:A disintegrin and metalloproteinase with thrombospondin motifs 16 n=1 Tax=Myotis davidii TaxID=225400 RepID=L5LYW8_MYODS|nr:A disintegrin and metalloproteinase with thrombospondin motifs 16 [Myotis davidii]
MWGPGCAALWVLLLLQVGVQSGMIRTQEADYFLKPLPSHLAGQLNDSAGGGPPSHILYKRSTEPQAPRGRQAMMVQRQRELENHHLFYHENQNLQGGFDLGHPQKQHFCGRRKKYMPKPPREDLFILPDEYKSCSRHKRSLLKSHRNKELNVETLVVVDKKMMQNHGHENITTYVLTILNMVSALFKDGTIGGNINIAIVGLILLEEEQPGLVISHHADHTLSSFCQWQSGLMGKDGTRHDHAILLTGLDICSWKNEPCDTLGFAPISGMCSKYRSCTINEDTGLGLAFTIAHESGHNFGMIHDGEGNMCKKSEGNIMSPTLAGRNGVFSWSPCSRQYLHKFLRPSHGGKFCEGSTRTLKLCNSQKCPHDSVDFRAMQCAEYNSKRFRGWHYKWKPYTQVEEYYQMVTIPSGARSIHIYEMNVSTSYIAVRNALKTYYLNGHWTVDWPGRYKFSGTAFNYRRSHREPESLTSAGPTNETLIVELLLQGRNPGIAWEYSVPRRAGEQKPSAQPSYTWVIIRSECSVSCGGGQMTTQEGCYRDLRFQCSRTCGKGWRKRSVACKSTNPSARAQLLPDTLCSSEPKPRTHEACPLKRCYKHKKLQWLVSAWSQCSVTCEGGTQKRFLRCAEKYISGKYRELTSKKCLHLPQPDLELERACAQFPCPKHPLFAATGPPRATWFASPWSQCTASCGGGVQTRSVQCLAGGRPAVGCFVHQKPEASLACNTHFCPIAKKKDAVCRDHLHWCSLVPQHGMCSHQFYGQQCCETCSKSNL